MKLKLAFLLLFLSVSTYGIKDDYLETTLKRNSIMKAEAPFFDRDSR